MGGRLERLAPVLALLLMLAYFAQGFLSAERKSLTWDEPTTLGGGYALLAWGDYDVYLESPPLMQALSAVAMVRAAPTEPESDGWRRAPNPKVALGVELLFGGDVDFRRVTRGARLPVLVFGTLLVGLVFLWGRALFGTAPALAAATLAAFEPNLIAHGRVATADMGATALMFAAVAAFWWAAEGARRPGGPAGMDDAVPEEPTALGRWLLCGLLTGLALVAKFSALVLGPSFVLLVAGLWITRPETRSARWVATAALPIAGMCWLVIAVAYGLDADLSLYRDGIARVYSDHSPTHYNYLLGASRQEPFWYYNLVAFVLKVPTAVLALLVAAAVAAATAARRVRAGRDPSAESADAGGRPAPGLEPALFLLVPAAVMVAVAFTDDANLGLRRILPAFPFLLLFTGYAVSTARSRLARTAVWTVVAAAVIAGISIFPHHLAFFNVVAGGPANAPYLLDDSNIDWGQDLPALAAWQAGRPADELPRIKYFGNAFGPAYGIRGVAFDEADRLAPRPGVYAMSVHHLVGFRKLIADGQPALDWLTEFEPVERLGWSIYVYEFE